MVHHPAQSPLFIEKLHTPVQNPFRIQPAGKLIYTCATKNKPGRKAVSRPVKPNKKAHFPRGKCAFMSYGGE